MPVHLHEEVAGILMLEDRENLHNWEAKQIIVKQKDKSVAQNVTETILTLRWFLVNRLIDSLRQGLVENPEMDSFEVLTSVKDYTELIKIFSNRLGRVLSRF